VIPTTLDNATQGELIKYENNYKTFNLITTALGRNVYDRVTHLELLMMSGLNCAILIRVLLRLSLLTKIFTIDNTKLSLRNLVNLLMTALLDLSPYCLTYILVVLLHILTMNVSNSCFMLLMIMYGA
jgi:hypothetical protein